MEGGKKERVKRPLKQKKCRCVPFGGKSKNEESQVRVFVMKRGKWRCDRRGKGKGDRWRKKKEVVQKKKVLTVQVEYKADTPSRKKALVIHFTRV